MPRKKIKKIPFIEEQEPQNEENDYVFNVPQNEVDVQDAPLWRRAAAYVIDAVFFYFMLFQIFMWIYLPKVGLNFDNLAEMQAYLNSSADAQMRLISGFVAVLFVFLFYFMIMEKTLKTTFGKKIMRLQIQGRNISYWDVFIRNITKTVLFFVLPFDLIGIIFTKNKRFTEKLTSAKVIYYDKLSLVYEL